MFCLVLHKLATSIKRIISPEDLSLWFLDDGHIAGPAVKVLEILNLIMSEGSVLGLHLDLDKCVVYGNHLDIFPNEISRAQDGLVVLGAPIGKPEFVKEKVVQIVTKAVQLMINAKDLCDPQMELILLRCCTGAPKFMYWVRCCSASNIADAIGQFDAGVDNALRHILDKCISSSERDLAHLPLSFDGLGIPQVSKIADLAFVSSVGSSWMLQPQSNPRKEFIDAIARVADSAITIPALPAKALIVSPFYQTKGIQPE